MNSFIFTNIEHDGIFTLAKELLIIHNKELLTLKSKLLLKENEYFLSGCKANIEYGRQDRLSGKQLRKLLVMVNKFKSNFNKHDQLKITLLMNKD